MKFILHEVKLWFKEKNSSPQSYKLLPNKINVITGDATTGKTSFWSIIDYCLMSSNINIANTINEKVAWYGIHLSINDKEISIARKSPHVGTISAEVYFNEGHLPNDPYENCQIAEIKSILDEEFGVTDGLRFPYGKDMGKTSFNISYRHFLLFNSLTEDIIGTSKTYFDTIFYGKDEYNKVLNHIFDLVIGVNDMENIKAQERISQIEREIKNIQSQQKHKINNDKKFERDIFYLIKKIQENGLIEYSLNVNSVDDAILIINDVMLNTNKVANNSQIFAKIDNLNKDKQYIKGQLNSIVKYRREYESYKKGLNKSADSLKPIAFLSQNLSEQILESYETKKFIESLEDSLRMIQNSLSKKVTEPLRITGDEKALQKELVKLDQKIDELNKIQKNYLTEGAKFIILGEVKYAYEQILKRKKITPIDTIKLNQLDDEKAILEKNLGNIEQVKFTMKDSLNKYIQRNYDKLNSLPAYSNCSTIFNDSEMILQLLPEGQLFPLETVGSTSNYMFMHLCFYLGLHEHMIAVGQVHVPQFLFIDQPSIPYYVGVGGAGNDDETKLLDAFSLLNSFIDYLVTDKKESFQIFMVEHAPKGYWIDNDLHNFHTVAEFINGKGLIPKNIYNENE